MLRNQKGQSLIELVIGLGATVAVMLVIVSAQEMTSKDNSIISQDLAVADLYQVMVRTLAQPAICGQLNANFTCATPVPSPCSNLFLAGNLVTANSTTFDPTTISAVSPYSITLNSIPALGNINAPLATSGTLPSRVSPTSNTLNINPTTGAKPGLVVMLTNINVPATLNVNFAPSPVLQPKNLSFPINLKTTTTATPPLIQITGCSVAGDQI